MKKTLTTILFCFSISFLFSQNINLDWYVGTWKYENSAYGEELIIKLKKSQWEIPSSFGGGTEDCLVGVYSYKKNNLLLVDNLEKINEQQNYLYPIQLLSSVTNPTGKFSLSIIDFTILNGKGDYKLIYGTGSILEMNTISPKTIKWNLVIDEQEYFYYDQIDRFPKGTNLPKNIILSKIE